MKLPKVVAGERTDPGHQVMYEGELQKLSQPNQERIYNLAQLLEKAHKVADEGNDQVGTLEAFVRMNEETQGPLMMRVEEVKKKHQALMELSVKSDKIVKWGDIISFKKRAASKDSEASELSSEQRPQC